MNEEKERLKEILSGGKNMKRNILDIQGLKVGQAEIGKDTVRKMRSSILFLGALLGRTGKAVLGRKETCPLRCGQQES